MRIQKWILDLEIFANGSLSILFFADPCNKKEYENIGFIFPLLSSQKNIHNSKD
jgi:hypothetical protein